MKKVYLILGILSVIPFQAQQSFEDGVPPAGWISRRGNNGEGTNQDWKQGTEAVTGSFSAHVRFDPTITDGEEAEDWLISPRGNVPGSGGILTFKQKHSYSTPYGNKYSVRISTASGTPTNDQYTIVEEWDETGFSTEWTTKYIDLSSYTNQIYVAFVMTSDNDADSWFIDDANFIVNGSAPDCPLNPMPTNSSTDNILLDDGLTLSWDESTGDAAEEYEVFLGTTSGALNSIGIVFVPEIDVSSLSHNTTYYWRVVPKNFGGSSTSCTEWSFTTESVPSGSACSDPIDVSSLPFNQTSNTGHFSDNYSTSTCSDNYILGDEVIYTYTPGSDTSINVNLSGIGSNYTGLQVLDDCPDTAPNCIAFFGNDANTDNIDLDNISVTGGTTYYIVISTWAGPQSTAYTLDISENSCTNLTADFTLVEDCDVSGGFLIDVNISDLGTATSVTITDDQGFTSAAISTTGTTQLGPYTNGTDVVATVTNNQDGTCSVSSETITQAVCPPDNDDCADAIDMIPATTSDAESGWFTNTTVGTANSGEVTALDLSCLSEGVFGTGEDIWFMTRVPAAGDITITTRAVSGSDLTDTYISVFDGNCGSLNEIGCDLDGEFNFPFSEVVLTNLAVDDILYVRVARESGLDGEFEIRAHAVDAVLKTSEFELDAIEMFPNPTNDIVNFRSSVTIKSISLYNILGQEVVNEIIQARESTVDISTLREGVYVVKVVGENNTTSIRRLIKNN